MGVSRHSPGFRRGVFAAAQNFSANGKFLASASATERYTSVWDLEAAGNASAAAGTALLTFSVPVILTMTH
jgi:hypothetical protein